MKNSIYTFLIILILFCPLNTKSSFGQWVQVPNGIGLNATVWALEVSGPYIYAGTYGGVFRSTNNGLSWIQCLGIPGVFSLSANDSVVFAVAGGGIWLTTNYGNNWSQCPTNFGYPATCVSVTGSFVFAGVDEWDLKTNSVSQQGGVWRSTNLGQNWSPCGFDHCAIYRLIARGTNVFVGAYYEMYRSTNSGENWIYSLSSAPLCFAISGSNIFAGTERDGYRYDVFRSTTNGLNWVEFGLNDLAVGSLGLNGSSVFAGTVGHGVYHSGIDSAMWVQKNEGFGTAPTVYALLAANGYIFAGTQNRSVWRRAINDFVGLEDISSEIPDEFRLFQNYPNPFNPITKIKFDIPKSSYTELAVYDVLGREITVLINEHLKPGTYEVEWDATNFSSGVYFYRITAEEFNKTRKMVLIK